jgi:kynureninase
MVDYPIDEFRAAYSRFLTDDRILLSGHSHQAWPDVARDAQLEAFDDAAALVDGKWGGVFDLMEQVGRGVLVRMGFDEGDDIAFGESTHQLVYRLLSTLRPSDKPRVVTTSGEFHSLYRQLTRLSEEGLEVDWVDAQPREGLAERVIDAITDDTALVAVSAVMFEDAYIVDGLARILVRAREAGALILVDAYHAFNAVPIAWGDAADDVFVCAGGYKYAGFGNGLCWLRLPKACDVRPVYTGWFADFAALSKPRNTNAPVAYGPGGMRFGGATFDASSLYRARAVLAHWERFGLGVEQLREIYTSQTRRIIERLDAQSGAPVLVSSRDDARRGSFVTLRHAHAGDVVSELRKRGVWVDSRGELLRIGPAPYIRDDEIDRGVDAIVEVCRELG